MSNYPWNKDEINRPVAKYLIGDAEIAAMGVSGRRISILDSINVKGEPSRSRQRSEIEADSIDASAGYARPTFFVLHEISLHLARPHTPARHAGPANIRVRLFHFVAIWLG